LQTRFLTGDFMADRDNIVSHDETEKLLLSQFIEGALARVRQRGQMINARMDEVRNSSDSFYSVTKVAKGIEAAELELEEMVKGRKYREVTASVAKIIAGAGELAKAETTVSLVKIADPTSLPLCKIFMRSEFGASHKIIVVTNETPKFYLRDRLRNSGIWSPCGALGLQAIIVSVYGYEKYIVKVSVTLMLVPPVRFGHYNAKSEGYVLATIEEDGDINFDALACKIRQHHSVHHALGRVTDSKMIESLCMSGGDPADYLGFPRAWEYFISNLDDLGDYLSDLAVLWAKKK
jgi:hypothetical protein